MGSDFPSDPKVQLIEAVKAVFRSWELFRSGIDKILKKVGEECTEVIIAAKAEDRAETVYEIADLCYHTLVLMAQADITVDDIRTELAGRHVIDHKVKQEKMT